MKKIFCLFLFVMIFLAMATPGYGQIAAQISNGLKSGDARLIASHFNENVELVILDKEHVCSREQGEMILNDFFSRNRPVDFKLTHQGGSDSGYGIGKLACANGTFRIYIILKTFSGKSLIVQLRIEKDQ